MELAIITVALLLLGWLIPKQHTFPQEVAVLKWGQRLDLPYTKEDLKMMYRIFATWRVESATRALTQHFEVVKGPAPHRQTRKMV